MKIIFIACKVGHSGLMYENITIRLFGLDYHDQ